MVISVSQMVRWGYKLTNLVGISPLNMRLTPIGMGIKPTKMGIRTKTTTHLVQAGFWIPGCGADS